ncbi:MAG: hypothetical protein JWP78_1977 [Mucilaginibacter sp.]|jgi:hypothetical protein|nr:hypothetical protein [Mucilaginibacter sp.]
MDVKPFNITKPHLYRTAGRAAIASGMAGVIAIAFLITYLVVRDENIYKAIALMRFHDLALTIQMLLLIPVAIGLYKLSQQMPKGISNGMLNAGIGMLLFTAVLLLLGIFKVVSDVLYTAPQGFFGVWLIFVNWRLKRMLPIWLRLFGMVVGLGLALVGVFCIGYALFVDVIILRIPAATVEEVQKVPDTPANQILHQINWVGAPMGVLTLPFWALLLGLRWTKRISRDNMKF